MMEQIVAVVDDGADSGSGAVDDGADSDSG